MFTSAALMGTETHSINAAFNTEQTSNYQDEKDPLTPNAAKLLLAKLIGEQKIPQFLPEILLHLLPKNKMNKL